SELPPLSLHDALPISIPHRVGVNHRGIGRECLVDLRDLACNRGVDLARRLDRFDDRRLLALLDPPTDFRQLDIDDITELRLRVRSEEHTSELQSRSDL